MACLRATLAAHADIGFEALQQVVDFELGLGIVIDLEEVLAEQW